MAADTEVMRLELQTNANQFAAQINACEKEILELQAALKAGAIAFDQFENNTDATIQRLERLRQQADRTNKELEELGPAGGKGRKGTADLGLGFLELSRGIEDAQYGLRGVLNNIPSIITLFGGPAGLAAGISITAVAFTQLLPYIQQWIKEMGLFEDATKKSTDSVDGLQKQIKEIEEKPVKLAVDYNDLKVAKEKLKELQQNLADFEKLGKGATTFQKQAGAQIQELLDEMTIDASDKLQADLFAQRFKELRTPEMANLQQVVDEANREIEKLKAEKAARPFATGFQAAIEDQRTKIALAEKRLSELQPKLEEKARADIGKIVGGATRGSDIQRQALAKRIGAIPGQERLAADILGTTPEMLEAAQAEEKEDARIEQARKDAVRKRDREQKRIQDQREAAGRAAEADPETKRMQAEIDRKFGGIGREGTAKEAADRVKREAVEKEVEAANKALRKDKVPDAEQMRKMADEREKNRLAQDVWQRGGGMFSPEQALDIAQRSIGLQRQQVDANQATQVAINEAMQAMMELANQMRQQQAWGMMMGNQFGQIVDQIRMPGPGMLWGGGP
jgi:hypothetical protein